MNVRFFTLGFALLLIPLMIFSSCSSGAPVIYQSPSGQAGTVTSSGGIIVSQQSLGLWVNGLGKATAIPDIVLLNLGIQSQDKTVAQAQKAAIETMNKIMQVLKSHGIADKDIQTTQYNIDQLTRWDEVQRTNIVIGYQITNMVTVKIRDLNKTGTIIDDTAQAGGDLIRINRINFTVDEPEPLLKIARDKAVQDAMDKAKQMAQTSGLKLGRITYINESTPSIPMTQNVYMKMAGADMAASPTPISAGELEFQVNVQLVYEIN